MANPSEQRVDEVSRLIQASPEMIYRALLDRDALLAWLPPPGMRADFERFDASVGGGYRMVLTYDDEGAVAGKASARTDVVVASFVALEENRRVVQDVEFESDQPAFAGTMRMTWSLAAEGDATNVTFTAEHVPEGISRADHLEGLSGSLANLAQLVE